VGNGFVTNGQSPLGGGGRDHFTQKSSKKKEVIDQRKKGESQEKIPI